GKVFGQCRGSALAIGSLKPNIGHTEAAAGVAGLIKAALCLHHKKIPPTPVRDLNPSIPFDDLGLRVVQQMEDFPAGAHGRFVGVNSFGFGGSNAHAVLAEAPMSPSRPRAPAFANGSRVHRILPISAESCDALYARAAAYGESIRKATAERSLELDDV